MGMPDWEERGGGGCQKIKAEGRGREGRGGSPSPTLCRAMAHSPRGCAHTEGTAHISANHASCTCAGEGHSVGSPVIVPIAQRSHRNGESLPDWV